MDIIKSTGMFIFVWRLHAGSFHPSSLVGKFIERGRRHRAIGDGRCLLFNGATTWSTNQNKKCGEGERMKNGKNTFPSCNVNTEVAFLLFSVSLFFPSLKRIEKVNIKKRTVMNRNRVNRLN